jgi:hypothetical protein
MQLNIEMVLNIEIMVLDMILLNMGNMVEESEDKNPAPGYQ